MKSNVPGTADDLWQRRNGVAIFERAGNVSMVHSEAEKDNKKLRPPTNDFPYELLPYCFKEQMMHESLTGANWTL